MFSISEFTNRTFASFVVRNYRLYFAGQTISMSGNWMQIIAQDLLVLEITGSGAQLGLVTALQTLPVLLFGTFAGVLIDRYPKRNILYFSQSVLGLFALILGLLTATDTIEMWMLYIIAFGFGCMNCIDNPARQNFVHEMVGRDLLANAVSLNSTVANMARVIGPTIAGALVAFVGISMCFLLNGLSFVATIFMLTRMNSRELHPGKLVARKKGQLAEGFRYVRSDPRLWLPLTMMAIVGTLSYEFRVTLPTFASFTFGGHAGAYAALTAGMGAGAVIGGAYTASRRRTDLRILAISCALFGGSLLLTSFMPNVVLAVACMVVVGFFSVNFTSLGNTTLQLTSAPDMRGRVMSLWTVAFMGSTPIGGPIVGFIVEHFSPRAGLALGGVAGLAAAVFGWWVVTTFAGFTSQKEEPSTVPER